MEPVTKWECYEAAKARIQANKTNKKQTPEWNREDMDGQEDASTDTLTDCGGIQQICGGIQPWPILPPPDEEE